MPDDSINRRDFLNLAGKAALLAAVVGGGELLLSKRIYSPFQPADESLSGKKSLPADAAFPDLVSMKSSNHSQATIAAIAVLGGMSRFISKGDKVTIKPNVGWDRTAAQGANTSPELVRAVAQACLEAGAGKVIVTDMSCNDPRRCFLRSGIMDAVKDLGVEVILPSEKHFVRADLKGEILGVWPVLKACVETDKLINMPVVKQHSLCRATIGMKNLFGILGGPRNRLHQKIDKSLADLADFFRPSLTVVDATRVMVRNGPVGGSPSDIEIHDTVIASTDIVAADAYSCRFLGLTPDKLGYAIEAEKRKRGRTSGYSSLEREIT